MDLCIYIYIEMDLGAAWYNMYIVYYIATFSRFHNHATSTLSVPVLKLISTFCESMFASAVLFTTSFILTLTVPSDEALPKVTALFHRNSQDAAWGLQRHMMLCGAMSMWTVGLGYDLIGYCYDGYEFFPAKEPQLPDLAAGAKVCHFQNQSIREIRCIHYNPNCSPLNWRPIQPAPSNSTK